jgi:hypothetical protein
MARQKPKKLSEPYPITASIPDTGFTFFDAQPGKSFRLARENIIPTIETGSRTKRALPRVLQRRLDGESEAN